MGGSASGGTPVSGGGRTDVTALFPTPARQYIAHLKQQFKGTDVEGLATQVEVLLVDPRYRSQVEREVLNQKGVAVQSGFIHDNNTLTMSARVHLGGWYPLAQGLPNYQCYAQRGLDELVRGYKPRETKK